VNGPIRRIFVTPGAVGRERMTLTGADAQHARWLGISPGDRIVALDGSGWSWTVVIEMCDVAACSGTVVGRALATERRTKVTVYQGVIHPYDYRRLLVAGTVAGVVAFVPVIADGSPVSALVASGEGNGETTWARLVRDAAESGQRGRLPSLAPPMLVDQAFDAVGGAGRALVLDDTGTAIESALTDRPFSIALFSPPPGGFSRAELERAAQSEAAVVAPSDRQDDPVRTALAALSCIYQVLEAETDDGSAGAAL
jgi:RsmE family RNA methyltransferase